MREHLKNPWCQSLNHTGLASHHLLCNPWTMFDTHLQSLESLWLIFRCVSISRTHNVSHSHCHIVTLSVTSSITSLPLPNLGSSVVPNCHPRVYLTSLDNPWQILVTRNSVKTINIEKKIKGNQKRSFVKARKLKRMQIGTSRPLIFRCVSISRTHSVSHSVTQSVTFSLSSVPLQPLHYVWHHFATP